MPKLHQKIFRKRQLRSVTIRGKKKISILKDFQVFLESKFSFSNHFF
jgi:hypothetical protein